MTTFTHRQLCEIGAKLLKRPASANGHGCHFALIEAACYRENPDVIGFRHGTQTWREIDDKPYLCGYDVGTVLLEAKTSRADFLADKNKPHRINPETGIGKWRYFICPVDLIKPEELPEKWGLIYVKPSGHCKYIKGAMAVPKESDWNGKKYRSWLKLSESFNDFAFEKRNIQNEVNLLCMALNRLQNPEELLYKQREYNNLNAKITRLTEEKANLKHQLFLAQAIGTEPKPITP